MPLSGVAFTVTTDKSVAPISTSAEPAASFGVGRHGLLGLGEWTIAWQVFCSPIPNCAHNALHNHRPG